MISAKLSAFSILALALLAQAAPADFAKQNALDAQALNAKFASLTATSSCTSTSPSMLMVNPFTTHTYFHY